MDNVDGVTETPEVPVALLTPKEEAFCVAYTTIGDETYGNGTKSAIAAKYSEESARTQAWKLLKKAHIRQRIKELYSENMSRNSITVDKVLADLEHIKIVAIEAKKYNTAKGCAELHGKYLAMFTDNINQPGPEGLSINVHPKQSTELDCKPESQEGAKGTEEAK